MSTMPYEFWLGLALVIFIGTILILIWRPDIPDEFWLGLVIVIIIVFILIMGLTTRPRSSKKGEKRIKSNTPQGKSNRADD